MRPLVHIGYHKTGSTWLQRQVFQPEMGLSPVLSQARIDALFVEPHCLDFDPNTARIAISAVINSAHKTPVISSENLSGHPFYGGRENATIASRLQKTTPDAHILIVTRAQTTMLPSVYLQYLKRGGVQRVEQFFSRSGGVNYPGFNPGHFEYDKLIALYQSLFEHVTVLTFEELARDPKAFVAKILRATGCPPQPLPDAKSERVSPSPPSSAIPLLRIVNRFRKSTLNPSPLVRVAQEGGKLDRYLFKAASHLPETNYLFNYVKRELAPLYHQSNANLSHLTNGSLDLSDYP